MSKVKPQHLSRIAYVYVRQSSPGQVRRNIESQKRQYAVQATIEQAGWRSEQIVVDDDDQGTSSTSPYMRDGFASLAKAVARGEVGVVASLEVSRLARNSPEWHHLLYVCRWTDTLVADENGFYDLSLSTDRLVLGVRGQMSEMEMDTSIHRLVEGRWNKVRRGESVIIPPAGYELDDMNQIVMTPDEAVAHAIRRLGTDLPLFLDRNRLDW